MTVTGHEGIKEVEGKNGKKRYQAQVWYDRKFITSKTFDSLALAQAFKKAKLKAAIEGTLLSAGERRTERQLASDLHRPMSEWAKRYIEANTAGHGKSRLSEYDQVGRLLSDKTMLDFSGKAGGQLIRELATEWRYMRFIRGTRGEAIHSPDNPMTDQGLRLRLSALDRLIEFAMDELPDELNYIGPKKPMDYAPPPAHSNKRTRLPTTDEYAALLSHFGMGSDMSDFLQVIDETGCRLSEVAMARGENVTFHGISGQVLGGVLTLHRHKTSGKVGTRQVPFSRYAAQILYARKAKYGESNLFPGLPITDEICKAFDKARQVLGFGDLQIKDFRRGFITRNIGAVSVLELMSVVGQSSLIDMSSLGPQERIVQNAVGHANAKTTLGYVTPEQQAMAQAFTASSRWPSVMNIVQPRKATCFGQQEEAASLERELSQLLARMRHQGMTFTSM